MKTLQIFIIFINVIFASQLHSGIIPTQNTYAVYQQGTDESNPKNKAGDLLVSSKDLDDNTESLDLKFIQPFPYLAKLTEESFATLLKSMTDFTLKKYNQKNISTISFDPSCINFLQTRYDNYMKEQLGRMPGMVEIKNPQLQNLSLLFFKNDNYVKKILAQVTNSFEEVENVYLLAEEITYNKNYLGIEWSRLFDQKDHGHYMNNSPHLTIYIKYKK